MMNQFPVQLVKETKQVSKSNIEQIYWISFSFTVSNINRVKSSIEN